MRHRHLALSCLVAVLLAPSILPGAGVSPRWRGLPLFGGAVVHLAASPASPDIAYAATSSLAGVFRTDDRGATWTAANRGLANRRIFQISVDPRDARRAFLQTLNRIGDEFSPGDRYRTLDGGENWELAQRGLEENFVYEFAFDPQRREVVYAATVRGLSRSLDGGTTWHLLSFQESVYRVAVDPRDRNRLLIAGIEETYLSTDGGATFSLVAPTGLYQRLLFDPVRPGVVWGVDGDLWRSADGGATWALTDDPDARQIPIEDMTIAPDGTVYGATFYGVIRSTDQGHTWTPQPSAQWKTSVGPNDSLGTDSIVALGDTLLAAGLRGLWRLEDPGHGAWKASSDGISAHWVGSIAVGNDPASTVYVTLPLNGLMVSRNQGATFQASNQGLRQLGLPPFVVTADPSQPETVHGATTGFYLRSEDTGRTWQRFAYPGAPTVTVVEVDPTDSDTVYVGGPETAPFSEPDLCHAMKTTDGGRSWRCLTNTRALFQLDVLAIDPSRPRTLYAVSTNVLSKSTDGGATWRILPAQGLPRSCEHFCAAGVAALAIDPSRPQRLYAGTTQGLFRSDDSGLTWRRASRGLAAGEVRRILIDPDQPDTLYAGVLGVGVYRSTNAGATWTLAGPGLPPGSFNGRLAMDRQHPWILYAGTSGRGVYKIDLGAP
jgi:photosystem II stability/assembly factor-like uncharacterized protein